VHPVTSSSQPLALPCICPLAETLYPTSSQPHAIKLVQLSISKLAICITDGLVEHQLCWLQRVCYKEMLVRYESVAVSWSGLEMCIGKRRVFNLRM